MVQKRYAYGSGGNSTLLHLPFLRSILISEAVLCYHRLVCWVAERGFCFWVAAVWHPSLQSLSELPCCEEPSGDLCPPYDLCKENGRFHTHRSTRQFLTLDVASSVVELTAIGWVVPGLIAHWFGKQGFRFASPSDDAAIRPGPMLTGTTRMHPMTRCTDRPLASTGSRSAASARVPSSGNVTATVSLPFTFRYYGTNYTQVRISSDGWGAADQVQAVGGRAAGALRAASFTAGVMEAHGRKFP